ncbi:MAG: acyltransferase [Prevotella sp.]|nr:acyltransferase [Prevotella sp.]
MDNKFSPRDIQSQTIDFLRFPLIIGVVFIHNTAAEIVINGQVSGTDKYMPVFEYCSTLFSDVLGTIAVPLFFFMSGFLFFFNLQKFNVHSYRNKLQSRAKSLLVPYLFWNLVVFTLYYAMQNIPLLQGFTNKELDLHHFLSYFWNNSGEMKEGYLLEINTSSRMPIAYQFWFIRDLIVTVILTPVIYFLCKTGKIYGVVILALLWLSDWLFSFTGLSSTCLFFFTAGAYLGISKRNIIEDFGKIRNLSFALYPIVAIADLLTKEYIFNVYIHKIGIITGIIFCFNLVAFLLAKEKIRSVPFLSAASFFIFAVHALLLTILRKISFMIFRPESDFTMTSLYFINVILTVFITLGMYYILRRFWPRFVAIITGGR